MYKINKAKLVFLIAVPIAVIHKFSICFLLLMHQPC